MIPLSNVNIDAAQQRILEVITGVTTLSGEINNQGEYLVFDSLAINEPHTLDVGYKFNLYLAISSKTKNKRLAYQPISDRLNQLMTDYQLTQTIEVGNIVPYSLKGLIVYLVPLTVTTLNEGAHHV